ncbi:uncharacterized protein YndB with AHSA1/START domain [Hamadaea flava]|uniref:SRPBCC family protein n=1 Tax=Hamadaea flava TaxID=1742688 RepID=A0ABV8LEP4_9ACTN|nr:SRPBCC family protein [Hamadaea flava]MCP2325908.1 uncharacterized protein YndB with AHSA1/START domain [Hamadaea flava]
MFVVETSVDVGRPIEEVFALVSDPRNDIRWWRGVREVKLLGGDGGVGTEYEQRGRLLGLPFYNRFTVDEHQPPRRIVLRTTKSLTPFTAVYEFTPSGSGGTRFAMRAEVAGAGHFKFFGPLFRPLLKAVARYYFGQLPKVF